jgi:hypothetical protein
MTHLPDTDRTEYEGAAVDRDTAYALLSNRRRRNVVHALLTDGPETTVSDLARRLAAWENGCDPKAISSKQRKRTYTAVRQSHLPKLADAGVVEYDEHRGTVRLTAAGSELRGYLWSPSRYPWPQYYAGVVVAAAAVVLLAWVDAPFASQLSSGALGALVLLPFAALTAFNFARMRGSARDTRALAADTYYAERDDHSPLRRLTEEAAVADGGVE